VSIIAPPGVYAGISTSLGATGVDVNAGATDVVMLRGLRIAHVNDGASATGIRMYRGGLLVVEDCVIENTTYGIEFTPFLGPARLIVKRTVVRNSQVNGIHFGGEPGHQASAVIDSSWLENSANAGIGVFDYSDVLVRDTVATGNGTYGFYAGAINPGASARLIVENSVARNNWAGIRADGSNQGNTTIVVSNSVIADNLTCGLCSDGGVANIESRGNNTVRGNVPDVSGTLVPIGGV
jgi:hypothetical protein